MSFKTSFDRPARKKRSRRPSSQGFSRTKSSGSHEETHILLKMFDISLYVGILAVLLAFAGRTPIGHLVLLISTGVTMALWIVHRATQPTLPWKWTGFEFLLLCLIGMVTFQLAPLSPETLQAASPAIEQFLLADLSPESLGSSPQISWNHISLAPSETRLTFVPMLCVLLLFLFMVQRFQHRKQARMAMLVVTLGVAAYALFGTLQFLFGNGKFFGLISHPFTTTYTGTKGSFTNANHFAGFLALALGPLLAWTISCTTQSKSSRSFHAEWNPNFRIALGGIASILLLVGIVLSGSRGGLGLAVVSIVITMFLTMFRRVADARLPIFIAVFGMIGLGAISLIGDRILENNAQELVSADIETLDSGNARGIIWSSNLAAQKDFRWFGTGLGTHRHVIPAFHAEKVSRRIYTHAENSYLQIGTENGILGWSLFALATLLVLFNLLKSTFSSHVPKTELPFLIGAVASFGAFLCHGTYDFAWYAPAYMLLLAFYLANVFSIPSRDSQTEKQHSRKSFSSLLMAGGLIAFLIFGYDVVGPAARAEPATMNYLCYTTQTKNFDNVDDEMVMLKIRVSELSKALQIHPDDIDNQIRMAICLRRAFELQDLHQRYPMPLAQVRAAVYSGGFEDPEQLTAWLNNKAVLQEALPLIKSCLKHARHASLLCPLRSDPLLVQAEYCFTNSPDSRLVDYYFARSERAEPHNMEIVFDRGYMAWNRGDIEQAFQEWQPIFVERDPSLARILTVLAPVLSPAELLNTFHPPLETLNEMVKAYQKIGEEPYAQAALALANETLKAIPQLPAASRSASIGNAFHWLKSAKLKPETISFIDQTNEYLESSVPMRRQYAQWLVSQREYALAEPHLEFCIARSPGDVQLKEWLQKSQKGREQMARESSMRLYR
ncbi:O-antigen ligase family protein [Rubinisphaera sp.]|uniref:O-antigen ligase family protein n=1 Tax=Rubinisphaera sp. TaxID=2024857 RepID=UPI0025E5DD66|nr:O-antigen ligase family protein [Rubinisphaera sp.]